MEVVPVTGEAGALKALDLADVYASGEVMERALRNFERLEQREFRAPDVFKDADYPWPADMEGRTLLGLTRLASATHRVPRHLDALVEELPRHLNERGYMGRIQPAGALDEQQLSGHGWLLRGLCELYERRPDSTVRGHVTRIVENLLLPAKGYYAHYPKRPQDRRYDGGAIGSLSGQLTNHWFSSTDIGCAFILLDGASHVYDLFPDPELGELIDEMIDSYTRIDFRGISCQTHATLSGLRGLLRYYEHVRRPELLEVALQIWSLYTSEGMTANYANCNWFGRPLWNEPCAMVDAFMAGVQLWRITGDPQHLEMAHGTYFNGLGYAQRPNGGFGCDRCPGPGGLYLEPNPDIFEAWWCCTMRGGEGLSRAIEYGAYLNGDSLTLPFYWDATLRVPFSDGEVVLAERTRYPYAGEVMLDVVESTVKERKTLRLFVPTWGSESSVRMTVDGQETPVTMEDGFATAPVSLRRGARLAFTFSMDVEAEEPLNLHSPKGHHVFRQGPLVLACPAEAEAIRLPAEAGLEALGNGRYRVVGTDRVLAPVNDTIHRTEAEARADRRQLLFED